MERFPSPEEVENLTFNTVVRGYARDEVQEFLNAVAQELRNAQQRADQAYRRAGEDVGDLLQRTKDIADQIRADAEAAAHETRAEAQRVAARTKAEAGDDAAQTRSEAESYSATTRQDADSYAARTRQDAENDARLRIERADARVRELEAEERDVRHRLDALRSDLQELTERLGALIGSPDEGAITAAVPEPEPEYDEEPATFDLTLQGEHSI